MSRHSSLWRPPSGPYSPRLASRLHRACQLADLRDSRAKEADLVHPTVSVDELGASQHLVDAMTDSAWLIRPLCDQLRDEGERPGKPQQVGSA